LQNFFLIIDTETSGLPKNWSAPYYKEKNWPHIIQIAWILFDSENNEVKRENYYIRCTDFKIDKSSQKIHHITEAFLMANGTSKEVALNSLNHDLLTYKPLVIGHFIEFDYHMINVEFERIGMQSPLKNSPMYCTMKASAPFVRTPGVELLKLNQFYEELFNQPPETFHNALADAINTAKIFFYLLETGAISEETIYQQNNQFDISQNAPTKNFLSRLFSF